MDTKALAKKLSSEVAGACACRKLREASRKVSRAYDDALRSAGIKANQFSMLAALVVREEATLTELAETLGMERTTLLRNLHPLERRRLIKVSPEGYRRSRSANITPEGIAVMEEALPLWRSAQKTLKKRLGPANWERIQTDLAVVGHLL